MFVQASWLLTSPKVARDMGSKDADYAIKGWDNLHLQDVTQACSGRRPLILSGLYCWHCPLLLRETTFLNLRTLRTPSKSMKRKRAPRPLHQIVSIIPV